MTGIAVFSSILAGCGPGGSEGGIDPGIIEIPVAFINRPIPVDDMGDPVQADLREPLLFSEGGDVFLRTSSAADASVINVSRAATGGRGDVKGLNASYDGERLIFSLRLFDPDPNDDEVPTWNIYEYDIPGAQLRRVIGSDLVAEEGDDLFPAYLPDGRIVFTSNRQRQSREALINEGKDRFSALDEDENEIALVLHVMNADGSDLHQISFNQSHDLNPQVLANRFSGQIVFSRWDNAAGNDAVNLYKMNPDGSGLEIVYGARSHATGTGGANVHFTGVREMSDGRLMVVAKPFTGSFDGGDILVIDSNRFVDIDRPLWQLGNLGGPGQYAATVSGVTTDGTISVNGRYSSAFPLRSGSKILVSKSICRVEVDNVVRACLDDYVEDPGAQEVSPAYSIWLYDMGDDTERPLILVEPGRVITEAIPVEALPLPRVIRDKQAGELDPGWIFESVGVVNIRSVYDFGDASFDGCFFSVCTTAPGIATVQDFADPANAVAAERPARFVRFVKAVGIPDPDDPNLVDPPDLDADAFGPQRFRGMREIVGYAPVEPDGSVKVKVPSNVPLAVEVLDAEGRRIGPAHHNWFQVQPGDLLGCTGCHDLDNGGDPPEVHARSDAMAPSINDGLSAITLQVPNTLIPGTLSPNPYFGDGGQSLAEVRFNRAPVQPQLSPDLVYDDYWTDPLLAGRAADASYAYRYADLDASVPAPTNAFCAPWAFNCRTIINYAEHIHPIWQVDRGANTCTACHTTTDAMGNDRVADGQLDLTVGMSDQNADHLKSYRELLFTDQVETLDGMGNLEDLQVPDGMGGTITVDVNPSMSVQGARRSYFIEKLTETELDAPRTLAPFDPDPELYIDHTGMLSGAELKLISEWLDLGAQNFNDPFDDAAPQN